MNLTAFQAGDIEADDVRVDTAVEPFLPVPRADVGGAIA